MKDEADLHFAWYARVVPLLCEYFHGDPERLRQALGDGFVRTVGAGGAVGDGFDAGDGVQVEVRELHGPEFLGTMAALAEPAEG